MKDVSTVSSATLVAEIKSLYASRKADKLEMQRRMVELRDKPHEWTVRQIAEATEVPKSTVERWLQAYDESLSQLGQASRLTPASEQAASDERVAKRVLASAPIETVAALLEALPAPRKAAVAEAAGHSYEKAKKEVKEKKKKERKTHGEASGRAREIVGGFASLGIVEHIEQATEELNELAADASISAAHLKKIQKAFDEFETALGFAKQLVGESS